MSAYMWENYYLTIRIQGMAISSALTHRILQFSCRISFKSVALNAYSHSSYIEIFYKFSHMIRKRQTPVTVAEIIFFICINVYPQLGQVHSVHHHHTSELPALHVISYH